MIFHNAYKIVVLTLELMKIQLLMLRNLPVKIAILQSQIAILVQVQQIVMIIYFFIK